MKKVTLINLPAKPSKIDNFLEDMAFYAYAAAIISSLLSIAAGLPIFVYWIFLNVMKV